MSFWSSYGPIVGFFFILFLLTLPRLTLLLFASFVTFLIYKISHVLGDSLFTTLFAGTLAWILWLLFPRFLIAYIATAVYWDTNPILCVIAWIIAFIAVSAKSKTASRKRKQRRQQRAKTNTKQPSTARQRAEQWWEVLGVSPTASVDTIKAAYRKIAKQTHPDTSPSGGNTEEFRRATDAYRKGTGGRN